MGFRTIDTGRYQVYSGISNLELEEIVKNSKVSTLQFSEPLSDSETRCLESNVFSKRPDITLRVFGFYGQVCDLRFLKNIPSVRKISVDCLQEAVGVGTLTDLKELEELTIGIYKLNSFEFLKMISPGLKKLFLGKTTKRVSIASIEHFQNLTYLGLEGQQSGIDTIKNLPRLEKVILHSISTKNLSYLEGLERLWSVCITLGSVREFDKLSQLKNLKHLEINQVRAVENLSFISNIIPLQNLSVQSLRQVKALPDFSNLNNLRRIYLENLTGLKDLASLEFAPALNEFIYVNAKNLAPEDLRPALKNKNVKAVHCGFGSSSKNRSFEVLAKQYEKHAYRFSDFRFH